MKNKIILLFMSLMMLTVVGCGEENNQQAEESKNAGTQVNENAGTQEEYVRFPEFESTTITGDYIDSSIFAEADVTMVNIWGTFCGPCINEMPGLAELYTELPTGCALVGLLTDVYGEENLDMAVQIVTETGVTYDNIIPDDSLYQFLAANITGVPTTIYVDSEGNILGGVVGARSKEEYKAILEELVK